MHIFSKLVSIWFLFFKTVITIFENTKNIILVFSKNYYHSLNLVFSMFFVFFITKKKKESNVISVFSLLSLFSQKKKKQISKTITKQALKILP